MSSKLCAAAFVVVACALAPMTAGAQGASVKVGKDGSVKVRAGDTQVETEGNTAHVQTGRMEDPSDDSEPARIEITGTSETSKHECSPGTDVDITGSSNTVTLTGPCHTINVTGASNKVAVDSAIAINVDGSSNSVTWKRGPDKGKKPKVSRNGVNNKVSQAK